MYTFGKVYYPDSCDTHDSPARFDDTYILLALLLNGEVVNVHPQKIVRGTRRDTGTPILPILDTSGSSKSTTTSFQSRQYCEYRGGPIFQFLHLFLSFGRVHINMLLLRIPSKAPISLLISLRTGISTKFQAFPQYVKY